MESVWESSRCYVEMNNMISKPICFPNFEHIHMCTEVDAECWCLTFFIDKSLSPLLLTKLQFCTFSLFICQILYFFISIICFDLKTKIQNLLGIYICIRFGINFRVENQNLTYRPVHLVELAIGIVAYEQFVFYTYLIHCRFR